MRKTVGSIVVLFSLAFLAWPVQAQQAAVRPVGEILRSFVEDFRNDPAAAAKVVFGVSVKGTSEPDWQVIVSGQKAPSGGFEVELKPGRPSVPTFIYTTDVETLGKIDRGEMNALTAMGKARYSDAAPMDIDGTPGFQPGPDFAATFLPLSFHFWTRGFPEIVNYSPGASRVVHGANMVIFYYQPGLRSAWGQLVKGQHVNADPKDQVNPFPSMFIGLKGKAIVKLGGLEKTVGGGQMIFVPPGTAHEVWNPFDEPAEFIILMFGDGA